MGDDVFEAGRRLLGKVAVQSDVSGSWVATAPLGFHLLNEYLAGLHAENFFPLGN